MMRSGKTIFETVGGTPLLKLPAISRELDGVELRFEEDALRAVAEKAIENKTGARGLRNVLEKVMLDIMYDLPTLTDVDECVITRGVIEGTEAPILGRKAA